MKAARLFASIFMGCVCIGGSTENKGSAAEMQVERVPLARLLSIPEAYDGKMVRTFGVPVFQFEDSALYLSLPDAVHGVTANALWIGAPDTHLVPPGVSIAGKYVMLEGVFKARHLGHLDAYSGSIENIRRVAVLPARNIGEPGDEGTPRSVD